MTADGRGWGDWMADAADDDGAEDAAEDAVGPEVAAPVSVVPTPFDGLTNFCQLLSSLLAFFWTSGSSVERRN